VSDVEREVEHGGEHQVTPLELFFDLTFVFAVTQVTTQLDDDPTWGGVFHGMLVVAALVGVERLRVVDERDGRRRGWRPAGNARLDGGDARRRAGGAGRFR